MPFNSNIYHRNKARREAQEYLARAREAKAGAGDGETVAMYARFARGSWRMYRSYLRMKQCDDDLAALRAGRITYAEFMAKWSTR